MKWKQHVTIGRNWKGFSVSLQHQLLESLLFINRENTQVYNATIISMLHDHDRLAFALSVLDGDEDAQFILADMFEEIGDRGLADFARAKKRNRHKRLDFVLAILPHRVTLTVVCQFLVHSLSFIAEHDHEHRYDLESSFGGSMIPLLKAISGVRAWAINGSGDEDLSEHVTTIGAVGPWAYGVQHIDTTMQTLHFAVTCAQIAESSATEMAGLAYQNAGASRDACRKVAKAACEMPKPLVARMRWQHRLRNLTQGNPDVLDNGLMRWQAEHTREVICELLEDSGGDQ